MYIELFTSNNTYRGKLNYEVNDFVSFVCGLTNEVLTIQLQGGSCLYRYTEENAAMYLKRLDHVIMANSSDVFTEEDRLTIHNSNDVITIFQIIHALRDLGLRNSDYNNVNLQEVKNNISNIIQQNYNDQVGYIKSDDDLTEEEQANLIRITDMSYANYNKLLIKSNSLSEILLNWPCIFAENLSYTSYLVDELTKEDSSINVC